MTIRMGSLSSLGLLAASLLSGCSGGNADASLVSAQAAASSTYVYFRCNATGWDANRTTRMLVGASSDLVTLSYDVTQPWMTSNGGAGDSCVFTETNKLDGWGTSQTDYTSATSAFAPAGGTITMKTAGLQNFQVSYPTLGRYRATLNRKTKEFRIDPERSVLQLTHDGKSAAVHTAIQDVNPSSGFQNTALPVLAGNIKATADGVSLTVSPHNNATNTTVSYNVPSGTKLLRLEYDLLDGSIPYEGKWYLEYPGVSLPRLVVIELPANAEVEDQNGGADLDPNPTRIAYEDSDEDEPYVGYRTPAIPELYDYIETPHFAVEIPKAYAKYQPATLGLMETMYGLIGSYSGQDVNQIQSQYRYSFRFLPNRVMDGWGGLSNRGWSTVNARLITQIQQDPSVDNDFVSVVGHELANGWWGLWEDPDVSNRSPDWITGEGHSSFLRAEMSLDLGYLTSAQNRHGYEEYLGCTSECGGYQVMLELRAKYGWGLLQAFYKATQNGTLNFRGMLEPERASLAVRFFSEQVGQNLAPYLVAHHITLTDAVKAELASRFPTANVPAVDHLVARTAKLRAAPLAIETRVADGVQTARLMAYACAPGGFTTSLSRTVGLKLVPTTTMTCGSAYVDATLASSGVGKVTNVVFTAPGLGGSPISVPMTITRVANVLADGGFETPIGTYWNTDAFGDAANFTIDTAVHHGGSSSAKIDAVAEEDARFVQVVPVQPNTLYRVAGWVRTENVELGKGAALFVYGNDKGSETRGLTGTNEFTYMWTDIDSGNDTSLEVWARLGGFSSTSIGTAWFDDLTVTKLTN